MRIPKEELTREHVLKAIEAVDGGFKHGFGKSRLWSLVHEGKLYPPKAVLGGAIAMLRDQADWVNNFDGGEPTNAVLRELGFEIVRTESL